MASMVEIVWFSIIVKNNRTLLTTGCLAIPTISQACKNFTGQATITTATTARRRMYNNYKKREHIAAQRSVAFL